MSAGRISMGHRFARSDSQRILPVYSSRLDKVELRTKCLFAICLARAVVPDSIQTSSLLRAERQTDASGAGSFGTNRLVTSVHEQKEY